MVWRGKASEEKTEYCLIILVLAKAHVRHVYTDKNKC